jgi:CheY-like chemotaxis protein
LLLSLINDILDLSKIEAGKMTLYLERFDLSNLIRETAATVQPLIEKNANQLVVQAPEDLGEMIADQTKVRQCLFNLLSNASKFTKNGTITLEVAREPVSEDYASRIPPGQTDASTANGLSSDRQPPTVVFRVHDTGIGMTPQQLEKLFQPFIQADDSTTRLFGGTGLGLTITQRFCQMMDGDITAESEMGRGSTFTIHLPAEVSLAKVQEQGKTKVRMPAIPRGRPLSPPGALVLVVDDDPAVRDLLQRFLDKEGFIVEVASSGPDGLQKAREIHPDVITLDVLMPGMDGWAVLTALKTDIQTADIPVIMLSIIGDQSLGYALGVTDYLTKPVDRERLVATLNRYRGSRPQPVLIIEDDAETREMLRKLLEKEGWSVNEAENGKVGLKCIADQPPALVMLDLMMPEMDGFEFVVEFRKQKALRSIPVLVVTAKELTHDDRLRLNGYVQKILQKGAYKREELLIEVRDLVVACIRKRSIVP